ncbi:hypothetical protein OUZ56_016446 [Daphnia magna]|uniref:Uncharacterized protein n=1 Tax=Daphnia magna TaxID=35525 RepID=A0ABR0AQP7_9CRUS|nr:hypothetical protein OUZ56_016446 [Daphnia magna]
MTAIRKAEDDDSSDRDPGSFSRGQPQYASFHSGYRLEAYLRAGKSEPSNARRSAAAAVPNLAPCAAAVVPSLGRPAASDVPSFGPLTAPQVYSMALARCAATRNPSPSHEIRYHMEVKRLKNEIRQKLKEGQHKLRKLSKMKKIARKTVTNDYFPHC